MPERGKRGKKKGMRFLCFFTGLLFCIASSARAAIEGRDLLQDKKIEVKAGAKGTVALFLSAKCPCSNSHLARVRQLTKDFPDFAFVAIHANADEPLALSKEYFAKANLGIPVIEDEKDKLADQFKALKTPHAYVIAPDGKVLYRGGVTNSANGETAERQYLREALEDVSAARTVRTPASRTLGCVIAR